MGKLKAGHSDIGHMIIISSLGTLIWGLLFYFFLHVPLSAATEDYRQQAVESSQVVTKITNFKNAHMDFLPYEAEIEKREKRVRGYLPASIGQGEFILAVERLALQNGMKLERIIPQQLVNGEDSLCLPLKVGLSGSYFSLLNFLQGLQQGERFVKVKDMSVKVEAGDMIVDLLLNIYAVPEK